MPATNASRCAIAGIVFALALCGMGRAQASPILYGIGFDVSESTCANSCPDGSTNDQLLPFSQGISANIALPGGDDIIYLLSVFGDLNSRVYGEADTSAHGIVALGYFTGFVEADTLSLGNVPATALVTLQASWADTITATLGNAPNGTPVEYTFSLRSEGDTICSQFASSPQGGGTGGDANYQATYNFAGQQLLFRNDCSDSGQFDDLRTMKLLTTVGTQIAVGGTLSMVAEADNLPYPPITSASGPVSAEVDPPISSFFIDPVTPGASYMTASGVTYLTPSEVEPVPEPASMLLLGTGLIGFAARRWHTRSQRS